jgi:hypothetical protein
VLVQVIVMALVISDREYPCLPARSGAQRACRRRCYRELDTPRPVPADPRGWPAARSAVVAGEVRRVHPGPRVPVLMCTRGPARSPADHRVPPAPGNRAANTITTRNARLAAIRSLFRYAALHIPEHADCLATLGQRVNEAALVTAELQPPLRDLHVLQQAVVTGIGNRLSN